MKNSNLLLGICKNHNITLAELGRRVGKSKQYMTELGKGRIRLTYEMAAKIALELNTTPDELFLEALTPTGTDY